MMQYDMQHQFQLIVPLTQCSSPKYLNEMLCICTSTRHPSKYSLLRVNQHIFHIQGTRHISHSFSYCVSRNPLNCRRISNLRYQRGNKLLFSSYRWDPSNISKECIENIYGYGQRELDSNHYPAMLLEIGKFSMYSFH